MIYNIYLYVIICNFISSDIHPFYMIPPPPPPASITNNSNNIKGIHILQDFETAYHTADTKESPNVSQLACEKHTIAKTISLLSVALQKYDASVSDVYVCLYVCLCVCMD